MAKRTITDTSDFLSIQRGDEILVGGKCYTVKGHERERRFGLDDPKFWVKTAVETNTEIKKIIKLNYFETFETSLAGITIRRFRNPEKEAEILELVKDHPLFMHGESYHDTKGNNVRILDIVRGETFFSYIDSLSMPYGTYFEVLLPEILKSILKAFDAIGFLHLHGFRHGDIRNDHLIIENDTGNYVWIDFDYDYETTENPFGIDIFGMGNILLYAIGMGIHELHMIKRDKSTYNGLYERLEPGDFSIIHQSRLFNLQKLYPNIPTPLNNVLMHFSKSANVYYENVREIIEDVNECLDSAL